MSGVWGRFELPAPEGRRLVGQQALWTGASAATYTAITGPGWVDERTGLAMATAVAVVALRPARAYLLPLVGLVVAGGTWALSRAGIPVALALGALAGMAVATGPVLTRVESVLAGAAGAGLAHALAMDVTVALPALVGVAVVGAAVGLGAAQSLLPGALRFAARHRIPSPGTIRATLPERYRAPCQRAWSLDQEIAKRAPDRELRDGLGEVGAWVYRLGLTLAALDDDIGRIDPEAIGARRADIDLDPPSDPFIRERRQGTAQHLDRLLEHRAALARERARAASLQDYALAYLEEARAGLAVAQLQPGEASPEQLGTVLEKLRAHAAESGARRQTRREVGGFL